MNKKVKKGFITKTFKLKTTESQSCIEELWKPAIEEYIRYFNGVSEWVCKNLTSATVGDLMKNVSEDKRNLVYYTFFKDNGKENMPMYWLFTLPSKLSSTVNNLIYETLRNVNPEKYSGNILGFSTTNYRRFGYFSDVMSKYRTKMDDLRPNLKRRKIGEGDIPEETLLEQTAYEVTRNKLKDDSQWEDIINYQNIKAERNEELIQRLTTLREYWKSNKEKVAEYINRLKAEKLEGFDGCRRSEDKLSMQVNIKDASIEKHGKCSYNVKINSGHTVRMLGNRQVVLVDGNSRREKQDICETKGYTFGFQIKGGRLYVILTSDTEFDKQPSEPKKVVGVDVNIKHGILATSMVDKGRIKGYVNIYKELVSDKGFLATFDGSDADKEALKIYKTLSKTAYFGILEMECMFVRALNNIYKNDPDRFKRIETRKLYKRENAIYDVLCRLEKKHRDDTKAVWYICNVRKLRSKCKSYFTLKEKYYELQKEYDLRMGYTDASTASKETMDKRRFENPFIRTREAQEILSKMANVERTIIGCRDNIVTYAFETIRENGYDTISLEYLDSSQFKKRKTIVTAKSLLDFHSLRGKDASAWDDEKWDRQREYYTVCRDKDGNISDFRLTDKGVEAFKKDSFYNFTIKAIHFADVKDKFAQLSNNSGMSVAFVPAAFSSQMDSKTHKIYCTEVETKGKKGKPRKELRLVNKMYVRRMQEWHVNGLNADYNSACNLAYIISDKVLREKLTFVNSGVNAYNAPEFMIRKEYKRSVQAKTLKTFLDTGHARVLTETEYEELKKLSASR